MSVIWSKIFIIDNYNANVIILFLIEPIESVPPLPPRRTISSLLSSNSVQTSGLGLSLSFSRPSDVNILDQVPPVPKEDLLSFTESASSGSTSHQKLSEELKMITRPFGNKEI